MKSALASAALAAGVAVTLAGPAAAQTKLNDIANYAGPDRMDRLVAAAKAEGTLTLYTVQPVEDYTVMLDAFKAKYGIQVSAWRAASPDVLRRVLTEAKAGRYDADVIEANGPELEAMHREGGLQAIKSPTQASLMPGAVPDHREWVGERINVISPCYNPKSVDAAALPKTWQDLMKPEWKGKLAVGAEAYDWLDAMAASFPSKKEGLQFFSKLNKTNGVALHTAIGSLASKVISGEIPLSLTTYEYMCNQFGASGAPIKAIDLEPSLARVAGVSVAKHSTHPNAALLFYEFALNEGQDIFAKRNFMPSNVAKYPLPNGRKIQLLDSAAALDNLSDLRDQLKDVFAAN